MYIDSCIQMLLYQNIPSSHLLAQLPSNFFAVRPRRCLAMFMNVFVPLCEHISNVRVNLHLCTRRRQRRRLSSRRTNTRTHTHLKKSTKIKRKQILKGGKCEGKRWWHRHNNAHNCRHASLLRGRGRTVCVCAGERQRIQRAQQRTIASAFSFKPLALRTNTHAHTFVCVREREGELCVSLSLCVRCALHLTLPLIPFSTLRAGVGFLTRSLTHLLTTLARSLSLSLFCTLSRGGFRGEFSSSWILTVH